MQAPDIQSQAFKLAALRSERVRIITLLVALGVVALMVIARATLLGSDEQREILPYFLTLIGFAIPYEFLMLKLVDRSIRNERDLAPWAWIGNSFIETLFPTAAILILTESSFIGPYDALVAPAAHTYSFFIILSTLRLSPVLCRLVGFFSASGYLAMVAYTYWWYPQPSPGSGSFTLPVYVTYCFFFLVAGFIAGGVAVQIRKHVAAALREAEARRKAERLEHDLSIARSIQQGLLPSNSPETEGFEIAGWSQPADQTGGDYYDWQSLPDGRTAITLADVTGHGIGPALVSAVCRAYSRASFSSVDELGKLLDRINDLLVEDLPSDRFITFVVCLLDPSTARVQLLSAGHGPLFLYTAGDDRVQEFDAHDVPFGLSSGIDYGPPQEIELAPGDMIVLITDGFFEWANSADEQFGAERLRESIRAASSLPPDQIISKLYSDVVAFTGGTKQADDLTAVIVKRNKLRIEANAPASRVE